MLKTLEVLIQFGPSPTERLLDRYILEMEDEGMHCPYCAREIHESWAAFITTQEQAGKRFVSKYEGIVVPQTEAPCTTLPSGEVKHVRVVWMICPNSECRQMLVRVDTATVEPTTPIDNLVDEYLKKTGPRPTILFI